MPDLVLQFHRYVLSTAPRDVDKQVIRTILPLRHGMFMRMSLDKGAARRHEQLAEILAEGDAVPPAAIPESHVQLVQRRLEHLAGGNVTPMESEQVWAQLRSRSSRRPVRRKKVAGKATAAR